MDARLRRYYRKKMSGGRSIIARIIDFLLIRVSMLIVLFLLMLQWSHSLAVAIPVAVLVTLAAGIAMHAYGNRKAEKYFKKDLQRIREKCLLETLTLMNLHEYVGYMEKLFGSLSDVEAIQGGFLAERKGMRMVVLHNHPSGSLTAQKTVEAYRLCKEDKTAAVVSLSEFDADAKKFAEGVGLILVSGRDVLRIAQEKSMLPDEDSAEERAKQEMEETIISMERIKRSAFSRTKIRAYIFYGIIAMLWPLLGGWRFYYPIIALLCFVMAFVSYKRGKQIQESPDIDLT